MPARTNPKDLPDFAVQMDWSDLGFLRYCKNHMKGDGSAWFSRYQIDKLVRLAGEQPQMEPTPIQVGTALVYYHLPEDEIARLVDVAKARLK